MKTLQTIKLLKGQFNPEEANEMLLDIIINKINFYKFKNLSSRVRFEKPNIESEKRIKELQEAKDQVISIVEKALKDDVKLNIESNISISISKEAESNGTSSSEESFFIINKKDSKERIIK